MSDYDVLFTELIKLRTLLNAYIDEHNPPKGSRALSHLSMLMITVTHFLDEERLNPQGREHG